MTMPLIILHYTYMYDMGPNALVIHVNLILIMHFILMAHLCVHLSLIALNVERNSHLLR